MSAQEIYDYVMNFVNRSRHFGCSYVNEVVEDIREAYEYGVIDEEQYEELMEKLGW